MNIFSRKPQPVRLQKERSRKEKLRDWTFQNVYWIIPAILVFSLASFVASCFMLGPMVESGMYYNHLDDVVVEWILVVVA